MNSSWWKGCVAMVAALLLVVGISACGGGSSSSSSSSSTSESTSEPASSSDPASTGESGLAQAEEELAPYEKAPTSIGVTEPLKERPTGSTWEYLSCESVPCKEVGVGLEEAAKSLGVNLKTLDSGLTPQEIGEAWEQVVKDKPDVAMIGGAPASLFSRQLEEASKNGTKVLVWSSTSTPEEFPGITENTSGSEPYEKAAELAADMAAVESNGKAEVLAIDSPEFPAGESFGKVMKTHAAEVCPECTVNHLSIKASDIGTKVPGEIVSYLQQHPETSFVFSGFGGIFTGVPAALKAAGIETSGVKLVSFAGTPEDYERIKNGEQYADIGLSLPYFGWVQADNAARILGGQQMYRFPDGMPEPTQILTAETLKTNSDGQWIPVPTFRQEYEKLWGSKE